MKEKRDIVSFVAQVSRSGYKRLINIPADKKEKTDDSYYKVYLVKVSLEIMKELRSEVICFVAQVSRSGYKRLINIPADKRDVLDEGYYRVYMVKVVFDDLRDL